MQHHRVLLVVYEYQDLRIEEKPKHPEPCVTHSGEMKKVV